MLCWVAAGHKSTFSIYDNSYVTGIFSLEENRMKKKSNVK
jgi:hypothetical protein